MSGSSGAGASRLATHFYALIVAIYSVDTERAARPQRLAAVLGRGHRSAATPVCAIARWQLIAFPGAVAGLSSMITEEVNQWSLSTLG